MTTKRERNRTGQLCKGTVVVAQLVEQSLPTPEVHGSNSVIGKICIEHLHLIVLKRQKIKVKKPGMGHCNNAKNKKPRLVL